jgi:DNA mismatch repair protein MutL
MPIKILPQNVADQIAAGEVVERPASVVKELVENSLDAGAENIDVYIGNGGRTLIEVRDDGRGMRREDAEKCVLRHATSKIQTIDDLFSIRSFGFRGEALAAISAVSKFELVTQCEGDEVGTSVKISGGSDVQISDASSNIGTLIRVQDLFWTTPARLEYLKTEETEYRAIVKELTNFALAKYDVSFKLFKDGKPTLDFPRTESSEQRVEQVLKTLSTDLLPVNGKLAQNELTGFVCRPGTCAKTKNHQYLFVNGRRIEDFKLNYAVREAFAQSAGIEKHLHPIFVLFLQTDPLLVDVNVHPRKLEVKFSEPREIFSLIKNSVVSALQKNSSVIPPSSLIPAEAGTQSIPARSAPTAPTLNFSHQNVQRNFNTPSFAPQEGVSKEPTLDAPLTLIGQVENKYIMAQSDEGVFFFDQHALHERQRFEQFWEEYKQKKTNIQKLLTPQIFTFTEEEISLLHEHRDEIVKLGFAISFPADDQVGISEVPAMMSEKNLEQVLQDIMLYFSEDQIGEHVGDKLMRKLLEYKSCRGAVMFGDPMQKEEMKKLLDDFQTTQWRNLCPHGRPNHFFLSFEDLNRKFHR